MCCDYEEILVQERIQTLEVGTMPRSITVILLNDLVDTCKVIISDLSYLRQEMILSLLGLYVNVGNLSSVIVHVKWG